MGANPLQIDPKGSSPGDRIDDGIVGVGQIELDISPDLAVQGGFPIRTVAETQTARQRVEVMRKNSSQQPASNYESVLAPIGAVSSRPCEFVRRQGLPERLNTHPRQIKS